MSALSSKFGCFSKKIAITKKPWIPEAYDEVIEIINLYEEGLGIFLIDIA